MPRDEDSDVVRLCDALTEAAEVLSRRPELAAPAAAVMMATFSWAAAVAADGHDPAAEITRVLGADPLLAQAGNGSLAPPPPETIPEPRRAGGSL